MANRTGSADLPLHGGRVPAWLATRMANLGRVLVEALVLEYGRDEVLDRLAHPFWFQAFGAVMGMDWHSSGITTSVLGALKRGLRPVEWELGLHVCGGRGKASRATPAELLAIGERTGLRGELLARSSKLVAKVDSAAVQDGFELYLHGFIVGDDGSWVVVQQGMNPAVHTARRYHWRSAGLQSYVDAPHSAIDGEPVGEIVNLTDRRAARSRTAQLELVLSGPGAALAAMVETRVLDPAPVSAPPRGDAEALLPHLSSPHLCLPHHHDVRPSDVVLRRVRGVLEAAHAAGPRDFAELLLVPGLGARTVRALTLCAEVLHGAPSRFSDPARFSLAHGGKDGHPFPVPLRVYDETLRVLRAAVDRARMGNDERLDALRRLARESQALERAATDGEFNALLAYERARSHEWGGRTVFGAARPPAVRQQGAIGGRPAMSRPPLAQPRPAATAQPRLARGPSAPQLELFAPQPGKARRSR